MKEWIINVLVLFCVLIPIAQCINTNVPDYTMEQSK